MKNLIKLLLLSPMAFSIIGCKSNKKEPTPIDVVIISGQSNGVGCTHINCIKKSIGASKYYEYMAGYEGVQIAYSNWTKDNVTLDKFTFYEQNATKEDKPFVKVMLGQGNNEGTFGPEIGIAERLHEKYEGKLFLIKCACGASNLQDDWVDGKTIMYKKFVEYIKTQMDNLKNMGYAPTIKAMCWMQGEGDSYDGYYQNYYKNTKAFVSSLRDEFKDLAGNQEFPFIDAGINNSPQWQYYKEVNEAKKQFADESENNIYIDTIEAGLHTNQEPFDEPDKAHYDSESQVLLGNLFAEQFEKYLTK